MANLLTVYTHEPIDELMQEAMQMNEYKDQPSSYQEIECVYCEDTIPFSDADKYGWFELEDGYACECCGEEDGLVHCCFCGTTMREPFTNNPWPACEDEDARCCSDCNAMVVMPARLKAVC